MKVVAHPSGHGTRWEDIAHEQTQTPLERTTEVHRSRLTSRDASPTFLQLFESPPKSVLLRVECRSLRGRVFGAQEPGQLGAAVTPFRSEQGGVGGRASGSLVGGPPAAPGGAAKARAPSARMSPFVLDGELNEPDAECFGNLIDGSPAGTVEVALDPR